eukprot:13071206-Heterocapsa_arctica.AAC.1
MHSRPMILISPATCFATTSRIGGSTPAKQGSSCSTPRSRAGSNASSSRSGGSQAAAAVADP